MFACRSPFHSFRCDVWFCPHARTCCASISKYSNNIRATIMVSGGVMDEIVAAECGEHSCKSGPHGGLYHALHQVPDVCWTRCIKIAHRMMTDVGQELMHWKAGPFWCWASPYQILLRLSRMMGSCRRGLLDIIWPEPVDTHCNTVLSKGCPYSLLTHPGEVMSQYQFQRVHNKTKMLLARFWLPFQDDQDKFANVSFLEMVYSKFLILTIICPSWTSFQYGCSLWQYNN